MSTPTIKITLKTIKHYAALSEETEAYSADAYIEGQKAFAVSNTGQGGSDEQVPYPPFTWEDIQAWDRRVAESYPPLDMSAYQMDPIPATLETVCHDLIADHIARKELKRLMPGHMLIIDGDNIRQFSFKGVKTLSGEQRTVLRSQIKTDYPGKQILNDMPFDEAVAAYRCGNK